MEKQINEMFLEKNERNLIKVFFNKINKGTFSFFNDDIVKENSYDLFDQWDIMEDIKNENKKC